MLSYHQKKSFNEPINLYLQTNQNGEPIIPFHLHVQPKSGLLSGFYDQQEPELSCNDVFTKFGEMTLELQLLVVSFCDRSTLFQLMHTSHLLRIEAQKLFWSDPNVWYQANDAGILGYEYGLNNDVDENADKNSEEDSDEDSDEGYEDYYRHGLFVPDWIAPDFLHQVQRLEVLLTSWTYANTCLQYFQRDSPKEQLSSSEDDEEDPKPESLEERIGRFWQSLQSFFPGVKHVILSDDRRLPEPIIRSDTQKLVARCPPELSVSVSALYKYDGCVLERGLFEQHGNDRTKRTLTKFTAVWNHSKILLPPRVFRGVDDIDAYVAYRTSFRIYFEYADRFLRLEAKEREHFQGRNKTMYCQECFDEAPPGDTLRPMTQPGEWMSHAIRAGHGLPCETNEFSGDIYKGLCLREEMIEGWYLLFDIDEDCVNLQIKELGDVHDMRVADLIVYTRINCKGRGEKDCCHEDVYGIWTRESSI